MRFLSALRNGEELFLNFLESKISERDLAEFFKEDGFNLLLNAFPVSEVRNILFKKKYPSLNLVDFGSAIYECGLDRMRTYDRHMRIFGSSIYVYVRHAEEWGGDWQGEYCYLMIADSIQSGDEGELRALSIFFEWLCTYVAAANPINDYPLLISWLLIKYRLGEAREDFVRDVEGYLKSRIEYQYLLVGDSYGFGVNDWLDLVELIPDSVSLDRELLWNLIYHPGRFCS